MRTSTAIALALVVLILNAGITLVLINQKGLNTVSEPASKIIVSHNQRHNEITAAVQEVEPAVVSVNVTKVQYVRRFPSFSFFDFFGDIPMQRQVESIGSGVIYDSSGLIVTNAHVVQGASEITVVLPDKREFPAVLVGIDDVHDVA
ncbi:MAG TPA: trypsin-like peptidase domain-containing protein, partial [Candidatus Syntrophosphaera sp.]|nr:trypsin-like peptidase domain-containing protein [Candidatus Syntrophosphaera sp.]